MKSFSWIVILFSLFFIAACGTTDDGAIDQELLNEYEVKQTFDEIVEDDFIFRLVSEKEVYQEGEDVNLFAEIIYKGTEEKIEIAHSAVVVHFLLHEQVRDYMISTAIPEIGMQRELVANERYRENYNKQYIYTIESESTEYVAFIEDFKEREDFPPGYYAVSATAIFHDGETHREIEAEVDLKVE